MRFKGQSRGERLKEIISDIWDTRLGKVAFLGLGALFAEQCILPVPNTVADRVTARYVLCSMDGSDGISDELIPYLGKGIADAELDWSFERADVADRVILGSTVPEDGSLLELKIKKRGHQKGTKFYNSGALSIVGCPGYVKFDVFYNGELVPGGENISLVYGMKVWTAGGPFDGWPNFDTLDILRKTDLSTQQIDTIVEELTVAQGKVGERKAQEYRLQQAEREAEAERQKAREQAGIDAYKATLTGTKGNKVRECQRDFTKQFDRKNGEYFTYTVKRGDNKSVVAAKFNACVKSEAFFPDAYDRVGHKSLCTLPGCRFDRPNETLHRGDILYVHPQGKTSIKERYVPK